MLLEHKGNEPKIGKGAFIAENSSLIGNVAIGDLCSVWFGAVVRGDTNRIQIGMRTNIQDLSVIHVDSKHDTILGDDVTVGHRVILHGCHIGNRVIIGMGAVVMNGVKIGDDCIIGAGALVTEDQIIPTRSLVVGFPAKVKRELTGAELEAILKSSEIYVNAIGYYKT